MAIRMSFPGYRLRVLSAALLCVGLLPPAAIAAKPDTSQPVLVEADRFGYDTKNALVLAEGNAEVIQGEYIVLADRITYNQNTGIVRAMGNVTVAEPTGNVYFADEAELTDAVKTGIIHDFRARLANNATFAAREARKIDETTTEMDYAVFSTCKVCKDDPDSAPFWQLKARKIRYDEEEQSIKYRDARMELFGLPVLYTPYFSHAAPDADRKSGLLTPEYEISGNLGARVDLPFYWNIAPQMDAVITPIYTTLEGPVIAGEFRHLTRKGEYSLGGSFTRPKDTIGYANSEKSWRGHIEGEGQFTLTDFWQWGFSGKRASDDTYLRRYDFGHEDLLTSKAYLLGYDDRTYANVEAVTFQGLRATDNADVIPIIHPLADVQHETAPGWQGSRFGVSGNLMALSRDVGNDSRRLSSTAYWRVPVVTAGGHVLEIRPQVRADVYSVSDYTQPAPGGGTQDLSGETGRVIPELWMEWKYPLIRRFSSSSLILEPTVQAVVGMNGIESDKVPNNDSLALEFSDSNLFTGNHYPGYDLVEQGTRVNYGIRAQWELDSGNRFIGLFGQNYHTDDQNLFPYSNDLSQEVSDYVGRVAWSYQKHVELAYRFRMDSDNMELKRSEVDSLFYFHPLTLNLNYTRIMQDPYLSNSEEVRGGVHLALNDNWSWRMFGRHDLSNNGGLIHAGTGVQFDNECITIATGLDRHYIADRDVEPTTTFMLQVFLKNLN